MDGRDDELLTLEADGFAPLPAGGEEGYAENEGARIFYASFGSGDPVVLLHGGLGNGGNWGLQVPALVKRGFRVVTIDSRGHGRSTRDDRPYSYDVLARDVLAVMDATFLDSAAIVGWSDGAIVGLVLALTEPARVTGVAFFGGNVDPSGAKPMPQNDPLISRIFTQHRRDYARLSPAPEGFEAFLAAVDLMMATQPNYATSDLARVAVPFVVLRPERDEFIDAEHTASIARRIPGATLVDLPGVSHFAPLQRPADFNAAILSFLESLR